VSVASYPTRWYSDIVIAGFGNKSAKDLWERNRCKALPEALWTRAKALMTIMHATTTLDDLRILGQPPDVRLHKLKGNRKSRWSMTIKLPWCITFWYQKGEFSDVRIENYHKG